MCPQLLLLKKNHARKHERTHEDATAGEEDAEKASEYSY